jgi:hypothetical protein
LSDALVVIELSSLFLVINSLLRLRAEDALRSASDALADARRADADLRRPLADTFTEAARTATEFTTRDNRATAIKSFAEARRAAP